MDFFSSFFPNFFLWKKNWFYKWMNWKWSIDNSNESSRMSSTHSLRPFYHSLNHFRIHGLICKQRNANISKNMKNVCHLRRKDTAKMSYRLVTSTNTSKSKLSWIQFVSFCIIPRRMRKLRSSKNGLLDCWANSART